MSWFKNPWLENNPWAQGTEEYQKWSPSKQSEGESGYKPKSISPFFVRFNTTSNYNGKYGFDTWTKEKEKFLTHVTYKGARMEKADYYSKTKEKTPPPYNQYREGTCFLCLQLGVQANLEMFVESSIEKPIFEDGDMFYIASSLELNNMVVSVGGVIANTVGLPVNNSMGHIYSLYPVKAQNTPVAISIVLKGNELEPKPFIDREIPLTVYFNKKNSTEFNDIGRIVFFPNRPIIVPVRTVAFVGPSEVDSFVSTIETIHTTIKTEIQQTLMQACIELKPESGYSFVKMDASFNPYIDGNMLKNLDIQSNSTDEFGNEVDANGNVVKYKKFIDKFLDASEQDARNVKHETSPFKGIVLLLTTLKDQIEQKRGGEGLTFPKNARQAILYVDVIKENEPMNYAIYHEISHVLGLLHSFKDNNIQPLIDDIKQREPLLIKQKEIVEGLNKKVNE